MKSLARTSSDACRDVLVSGGWSVVQGKVWGIWGERGEQDNDGMSIPTRSPRYLEKK